MPSLTLPSPGETPPLAAAEEVVRTCANCGSAYQGDFCPACGQHALDSERLTIRALWREFSRRFLHFERGLLLTVREMTTDPGGVIRRYNSGQRKRYVNPLGFLVMAVAFNLAVHALSGYEERALAQMMESVATAERDMTFAQGMQEFTRWSFDHLSYLTVLVCVFMAVFLRLYLGKTRMNVAEGLVFGLFCYGQVTIIGSVLEIPYIFAPDLPYSVTAETYLDLALLFGITGLAAYQLFGKRLKPVLLTALSLGSGYAAYFVVQIIAMIVFVVILLSSSGERAWTLHDAVAQNRVGVVTALLDEGADPNATTGETPLLRALEEGHDAMVELLLARGANPDRASAAGRTPLLDALHYRREAAAMLLLDGGADVNLADSTGMTPLMEAVTHKHEAAARRLLAAGADPNAIRPDKEEATALMIAAHKRRTGAPYIALLLEHGADPSLTNGEGQTALDLARNDESRDLLREALAR